MLCIFDNPETREKNRVRKLRMETKQRFPSFLGKKGEGFMLPRGIRCRVSTMPLNYGLPLSTVTQSKNFCDFKRLACTEIASGILSEA